MRSNCPIYRISSITITIRPSEGLIPSFNTVSLFPLDPQTTTYIKHQGLQVNILHLMFQIVKAT